MLTIFNTYRRLWYTERMKHLHLVTGNAHKLKEWQQIIPTDITMDIADVDLEELQSDNVEEIVQDKARRAYEVVGNPVVVEDVSAGLDKLNGLPGPFIKFFNKRLGGDALYQLAGREEARATVSASVAYYDGEEMIVVRADIHGRVVEPRTREGFGFDITFLPDGETLTFAEMSPEKKHSLSHRGQAIRMLLEKLNSL